MKKVLILTRFRGEYEPKRLAEEAEKLGYVADKVNYEHIRVGVSILGKPIVDLGNGKKVEDYDLIVPRAASKRGAESMLGVKTILLEYVEQAKNQKIENLPVGKASIAKFDHLLFIMQRAIHLKSIVPFVLENAFFANFKQS